MPPLQRPRPPPSSGSGDRIAGINLLDNLSVGQSGSKPGSKPAGQWSCSSCGKSLGPQSVIQGAGIVLDGNLICVECVKSGKKRGKTQAISASLLIGCGVATAVVLGIVGIFLPSQALLITLLLAAGAVLVGMIGFTLSGTARLATIAGGLVVVALSIWGLSTVNEHTEASSTSKELSIQSKEIREYLDKDCIVEALLRVASIEDNLTKASAGHPSVAAQKGIAELRAIPDAWLHKNFGELNATDRDVLFALYKQFGSLTLRTKTRRVRAFKISGNTIQATVATDLPADLSETTHITHSQDLINTTSKSGSVVIDEAGRLFITLSRKLPTVDSITLKIISGDSDEKELFNTTLDQSALKDLRHGKMEVLYGGSTTPRPEK